MAPISPPSCVKSVREVCWILLEDLGVDNNENEDGNDDGGEQWMECLVDHEKLQIFKILFKNPS